MLPEQEQIFNAFFRENFDKLVVHAYCYTKDWHLAKDVTQDAFGKLLDDEMMEKFLKSENRVAWMRGVVINTARNAVRSRRRQLKWLVSYEELYEEPSSVDRYPSENDIEDRCANLLTKEQLRLFKRITMDGLSYIEAAEELGISMWACYKRVEKIKAKLRKGLDDNNN